MRIKDGNQCGLHVRPSVDLKLLIIMDKKVSFFKVQFQDWRTGDIQSILLPDNLGT